MTQSHERWTTGTNEEWMKLDRQYRIQHRYTSPIALARGEGRYLYDVEGKRYLDFESGQSAAMLGHCHPRYVEVLSQQLGTLVQTGSVFSPPTQILLAMKLAGLLEDYGLSKVMFGCNGTDATEMALLLSKVYTGRFEVATAWQGNHGQTYGSFSIEGGGSLWEWAGPRMPGVVMFPNLPNCPDGDVNYVRETIGRSSSGKLAALVIEPIQGAAGLVEPTVEWLQGLRDIAHEFGALLIYDESHSGLGKTGKWFAFEHFGVPPDIILLSKGFGEMPVSAVITTPEIADKAVERGFWWSMTHQGDAGLMAAGLTAIEIIETEKLVQNAAEVGGYLKDGLSRLSERHEIIGPPRGLGMMLGFQIVKERGTDRESGYPEAALALRDKLWELGLHVFYRPGVTFGFLRGDLIRISPALSTTMDEAQEGLDMLEEATRAVEEELLATTARS